jgi:hypothetical protein
MLWWRALAKSSTFFVCSLHDHHWMNQSFCVYTKDVSSFFTTFVFRLDWRHHLFQPAVSKLPKCMRGQKLHYKNKCWIVSEKYDKLVHIESHGSIVLWINLLMQVCSTLWLFMTSCHEKQCSFMGFGFSFSCSSLQGGEVLLPRRSASLERLWTTSMIHHHQWLDRWAKVGLIRHILCRFITSIFVLSLGLVGSRPTRWSWLTQKKYKENNSRSSTPNSRV